MSSVKNTNMHNQKKGALIIEGHVQGLSNTRSLGEMGVPVYVVDKNNCIARYSKYCKKFFRCPDYKSDELADFLMELAEKENLSGWVLIPSNDHAVYTLSKHKQRLEQYYKIITPGLEVIDKIYDKVALLQMAQSLSLPIPRTHCFESVEEKMPEGFSFPVITKGRHGLTFYKALGRKVFLAHDEAELRKQLQVIAARYELAGTFTQELIPDSGKNKTISFTAFCENGEVKTHWMGVKLREHPLRFGTATFARSIYVEACLQQSIPLLHKLGYTGVCEVEYLQDPRDGCYKLIEINPRTWLWVGLAKACGVDYAKMIYHHVNDLPYAYPRQYETDLYWINPITDSVFAFIAVLKVKLNVSTYFATLVSRNKINALAYKGDMKPVLAYFMNLFAFLKQR